MISYATDILVDYSASMKDGGKFSYVRYILVNKILPVLNLNEPMGLKIFHAPNRVIRYKVNCEIALQKSRMLFINRIELANDPSCETPLFQAVRNSLTELARH